VSDAWRYDGKRVVVTGCSSGIGEATAREATRLGAEVVGLDVKDPATAMADFLRVDLSEPTSIDAVAATVTAPVHALFNCAGLSNGAADAMTVMRVNFIGTRRLTEALIERMPSGAAVATIASLGGIDWQANFDAVRDFLAVEDFDAAVGWCDAHPEQFRGGAYAFSKQALIVYTKQQCIPWAARGIRANVIGPSPTETPMLADSVKVVGRDYLERFPQPLGRPATAIEQANVLLFLNSDAASYVTGQLLWTDGGYTAGVLTGQVPPVVGQAAARDPR
jgi:NAD(P)-dependent dehydrogenase (short-subunit alcohol dehydrogenase family)